MRSALIGHTGFVGGNLLRQTTFTECYHSRTIDTIQGKCFDLVVCCGAPAEKWRANRHPDEDRANLVRLMDCLETVRADKLILISTVDVFASPRRVYEDSPVTTEGLHAYGRHRYLLEHFVRERFDTLIVRLPGLFGPGLKKNVIFDFLHDNQLERVHSDAVYQFYDLENLWHNLQMALRVGLSLVHFATEPLSVAEIAAEGFGFSFHNPAPGPAPVYDFRSRHAHLFGGRGGYLYSRAEVLEALRRFVGHQQRERRCA